MGLVRRRIECTDERLWQFEDFEGQGDRLQVGCPARMHRHGQYRRSTRPPRKDRVNTEFNPTDSLVRPGSYTGEESHLFDTPQRSLHIRAQGALVLHTLLFEDQHPFFKTKRIRDPGDVNFLRP